MQYPRLVCAAALAVLAAGCGPKPSEIRRDLVLKRSAREWECAKEAIAIRHLGSQIYEAKGCGQRATYVCTRPVELMGMYAIEGKWRCVLESRDGYRSPQDYAQGPAPAPRPAPKPAREAMPGWSSSGAEAPAPAAPAVEPADSPPPAPGGDV